MIQLSDIGKRFPGTPPVRALDHVTLSIDEGEFVAIVGPSGSGKSSLLNIIGLLDRPTEGSYRFAGEDMRALPSDRLAAIRNRSFGFVFQSFQLIAGMTAEENVAVPLEYAGVRAPQRQARTALASVGLEDRAHHAPSALSGGQQQRVAIARALVNTPRVIVADEPTGNLDAAAGNEIMDLFLDLHRRGTTILLVTHDAGVAARADRILRVVGGRILSDTSTRKENA